MKVGIGKAEAAEDFSGARRRAIRVDRVQLLVNVGKLFRLSGFQRRIERFTLRIGGQNCVEETRRRRRMLLIDRSDAVCLRQQNLAAERNEIADDELEQGRFADAVAADHAHLRPGRYRHAGRIKESPPPGVKDEVLDPKHVAGAELTMDCGERGALLPRRA